MTFGQKIKKLRIDAGLTQKELAEKMNVSFQTVSKWESDQNEPDITNIKELSKIFNCSFEYLFSDDTEPKPVINNQEEVVVAPIITPTKQKIGNCCDCGKELIDGDVVHNIDRKSSSGDKEAVIICDECFQKHEKEVDEKVKQINQSVVTPAPVRKSGPFNKITDRDDSKVLIWSIVVGVLALVITLIVCIVFNKQVGIGWTIGLPILIGYALLADIYCIFTASWISDVFMEVASWSIKMPGIIFTLDADGLKFLIVMKIALWLLGIAISIATFLLAVALSAFFAIFTFPFLLIYNKRHY